MSSGGQFTCRLTDHIARAPRTMRKFQSTLHRLSPDAVDEMVWNLVVRGYYYSAPSGDRGAWDDYLAKYQDIKQPRKYLEFLLRKRMTYEIKELPLDREDFVDVEAIVRDHVGIEDSRLKASFREPEEREERLVKDVRLAVGLAKLHLGLIRSRRQCLYAANAARSVLSYSPGLT